MPEMTLQRKHLFLMFTNTNARWIILQYLDTLEDFQAVVDCMAEVEP